MLELPKITIVTPSYNQGQFLEETIQSVLGQCYPNLEYMILDGGSTDNSVEIIQKYEKHLAYWTSAKDGGQSAAINAGFGRATGDIFGWLNSDDMYLPGALHFVADRLSPAQPQIVFGNCLHIREQSPESYGSDVTWAHNKYALPLYDYIIQPSSFWTKKTWDSVGLLDQNLHFGFDWEWYLRADRKEIPLSPVSRYLSVYRLHEAHKTGTGGDKRQAELATIYEKYAGKRYADLYLESCQSAAEVNDLMSRMRRFHLSRISLPVLRFKYPKLFRNIDAEEAWSVIRMVGYD